ncbi:MAG TPA: ankyrin repeat domain-containing protein [Gaiellaceae bacterium]|jgi:ankyrin repeat protein|nr:ankyrin repeat domain-containing protein [Gaiellaceae bacterium]
MTTSPLLQALYEGRRDDLDRLRAESGELDLFEASALGDVDRLRELLDGGADPNEFASDGFTPLTLAAFFNQPEAVRLLLDSGADVHQRARNEQIQVLPIHSAAADGGSVEIVRMLLDAGADVNATQPGGFRAIDAARQEGNEELEQLLLERGAEG